MYKLRQTSVFILATILLSTSSLSGCSRSTKGEISFSYLCSPDGLSAEAKFSISNFSPDQKKNQACSSEKYPDKPLHLPEEIAFDRLQQRARKSTSEVLMRNLEKSSKRYSERLSKRFSIATENSKIFLKDLSKEVGRRQPKAKPNGLPNSYPYWSPNPYAEPILILPQV